MGTSPKAKATRNVNASLAVGDLRSLTFREEPKIRTLGLCGLRRPLCFDKASGGQKVAQHAVEELAELLRRVVVRGVAAAVHEGVSLLHGRKKWFFME